jgi:hypothetical protein
VDCEAGSPKYAKIVTTPGTRLAKIREGSKPLPEIGATFDLAAAGNSAGCELFAFTTTVFEPPSSQPALFPIPSAAPPPRTAATMATAAMDATRIGITVARVL